VTRPSSPLPTSADASDRDARGRHYLTPGLPLLLATICWFAPLAALRFGALDLLKHAVLRLLLSRQGLCPLRFPRFLEHATRRGLLRRAGGSYLFFHSTLMEYLGGSERD
jgi:hypothetical protein